MGWGLIPSYKKERQSIGRGTASIWKSINNIYDQLNVEYHNHDKTQVDFGMVSGAVFTDLVDIPQGDLGESSRTGDKIRLKTCNIKLKVDGSATTSPATATIMLIKYYDNFLGNPPAYADMWNAVAGIDNDLSLRNLERGSKTYKILHTRKVRIEPQNNELQTINIFHKFKKVGSYVEYDGALSSSPSNGKIYLLTFHDGNFSVNPLTQFTTRVTYIDN